MAEADFGYILRRLRHNRGETLEQVSEATGLSTAMLSRVERGERLPSPESVEALAKHFDLPVDYLMSETIARRLVNRYGEETTSRAAERLSREPISFGLMARPARRDDERYPTDGPEGRGASDRRGLMAYGPFEEKDVLNALAGDRPERVGLISRGYAAQEAGSPGPLPNIDPVTERVLRAASEATEAATVLVEREVASLPAKARLELTERISALAAPAVGVLRRLAADPDPRVREKARDALKRLAGR